MAGLGDIPVVRRPILRPRVHASAATRPWSITDGLGFEFETIFLGEAPSWVSRKDPVFWTFGGRFFVHDAREKSRGKLMAGK